MATSSAAYAAAPLLLNLEPDGGGGWLRRATWCNLGLWEGESSTYVAAAAALARRLGEAAALTAGDVLLDVGAGYADSTALWCREFAVHRVVGVEPQAAQVAAGRALLEAAGLTERVELCVGSATALPSRAAVLQPYDAVVCLDCAYHFATRARFLREAAAVLRRGGRYAAVDLVVPDEPSRRGSWGWRPLARMLVAAGCGIPRANLHGAAEYDAALRAAGFEHVAIDELTPRVFAPFAANARRQRARLAARLSWGEWAFLTAVGAIFSLVARGALFRCVVVSARRT